jgi:hypothetical protein
MNNDTTRPARRIADDLTTRLLGASTSTDINVVEPNLWKGREMPGQSDIPLLDGVAFYLIKPYSFAEDGYRFLHGVAVAWHKGRFFASFGHNRGPENTATEEARGRVSDDGGVRRAPLTIALTRPGESLFSSVFAIRRAECTGWAVESHPIGSQADEGTIYISYERNRWRQPEILLARFTEADVLAGKTVSPRAALRRLVNKAMAICPKKK